MPAVPVIDDIPREVGPIEVLGEGQADQPGRGDDDVGVAGKIEVHEDRIGIEKNRELGEDLDPSARTGVATGSLEQSQAIGASSPTLIMPVSSRFQEMRVSRPSHGGNSRAVQYSWKSL